MVIDFDTVLYASLILYALYAIAMYIRHKRKPKKWSKFRMILIFAAWMYNFTLFPIQLPPTSVKVSVLELVQINPMASFSTRQISFFQLIGNVCLFLPLIPFVSILRKKVVTVKYAALFSFIVSVTIEILQLLEDLSGLCSYFFRQADTVDVLMNVLGGIIGCVIGNILVNTHSDSFL